MEDTLGGLVKQSANQENELAVSDWNCDHMGLKCQLSLSASLSTY